MTKYFNTLAFILIIGYAGAWECGSYEFDVFLNNTGITLSLLFFYHFLRTTVYLIRHTRKIRNVKIS